MCLWFNRYTRRLKHDRRCVVFHLSDAFLAFHVSCFCCGAYDLPCPLLPIRAVGRPPHPLSCGCFGVPPSSPVDPSESLNLAFLIVRSEVTPLHLGNGSLQTLNEDSQPVSCLEQLSSPPDFRTNSPLSEIRLITPIPTPWLIENSPLSPS